MRTIPTSPRTQPVPAPVRPAAPRRRAPAPAWRAQAIMADPSTAGVLHSAWSGDPAVVVPSPPGAGKTRLVALLAATLAGVALGASGATFQLMARNPLASPDVLGLTMGASAAAVFTLVVLGGSGAAVTVAALLGSALVAVALLTLSASRPGSPASRISLASRIMPAHDP